MVYVQTDAQRRSQPLPPRLRSASAPLIGNKRSVCEKTASMGAEIWTIFFLHQARRSKRSQTDGLVRPSYTAVLDKTRSIIRERRHHAGELRLIEFGFFEEPTEVPEPLAAELRLGRRTILSLPLFPPPQKNRSAPSDSSPETYMSAGISRLSRTFPVCGSTRRSSLSSPSDVACQSSPSTHVTPVTKRFDSMVRRIAPVSGST